MYIYIWQYIWSSSYLPDPFRRNSFSKIKGAREVICVGESRSTQAVEWQGFVSLFPHMIRMPFFFHFLLLPPSIKLLPTQVSSLLLSMDSFRIPGSDMSIQKVDQSFFSFV